MRYDLGEDEFSEVVIELEQWSCNGLVMQYSVALKPKCIAWMTAALFVASCQNKEARPLFENEAVWINAASLHGMYWVAPGLDCLGFPDEMADSGDNLVRVDGGRLDRDAYNKAYKAVEAHNSALSPEIARAACPIASIQNSSPK
nr:hypothetical protein [uncultured Brevundimonas sp.]